MKNPEKTEVRHFRLKKTLIKKLLNAAEKSGRTMRSEAEQRLEASFKKE